MKQQPIQKQKIYQFLLIGAGVGLLILIAIILYWFSPKNDTPQPTSTTPTIVANIPTSPISTPAQTVPMPAPTANLPPLPRSLQGTQVDGEIIIDDNKNLVVTKGLRRLFDYFLSAQGEEPLDIIHKRVADYIRTHTPEPASTQALTLYFNYIKYLDGIAGIEKQYMPSKNDTTTALPDMDLDKIKRRQVAVDALQKTLFDEKTIQAFFGEENSLNRYTMTTIQTNNNKSLTEEQKAQAIANAKQQYLNSLDNPELKNQLQNQANIEKLLEETQILKAQGASQAELNAMRRKYVDANAVQRLDKLDQQEQSFDNKFTAYQQQRDSILATQGDTAQAQNAIEKLQRQNFTEQEIKRLDGYESVKKAQAVKN